MSGRTAHAAATRHTRRVGGRCCVQAAIANPTAACETGVGTGPNLCFSSHPVHQIDTTELRDRNGAAVSPNIPFPELHMGVNSDINVTPMIDVMLVLLVVFMLSVQL